MTHDPGGRRRIQFVDPNGDRKTIRLGVVAARQAESIRRKVEAILAAIVTATSPDPEVSRWVAEVDDRLHEKLARTGLVKPRAGAKPTLGTLTDAFFGALNVRPGTVLAYAQARRSLEGFFGRDRALDSITVLDAETWRQSLKKEGLAGATISKRVRTAKLIFRRGVKWKMLAESPLADLTAGSQVNASRMYFVTRDEAEKVLDACPDAEWRVIFALARFGGLRTPSETLLLKWSDIDWDKGRIVVRSPKTLCHAGREYRMVPLFPELKRYLLEAFEQARPGADYVITRYRQANCNLRTQLFRIMARAGVGAWPRLFHNLRSTRQSELTEQYPGHVVCAWIGNTQVVAQNHYLQVRDLHFQQAVAELPPAEQAAQKAAQSGAAPGGTERKSAVRDVA